MNEFIRQEYLDVLGIDSFVPRRKLLGAKPSIAANMPVYELPSVDARDALGDEVAECVDNNISQSAESEASQPVPNAGAGAAVLSSILGGTSEKDTVQSHKHPRGLESIESIRSLLSDDVDAGDSLVPAPHFSLSFWSLSDVLVVDVRDPGEALPFEALLENILQQTPLLQARLPRSELLHWPVRSKHQSSFPRLVSPEGYEEQWGAARDMVQGFVESRIFHSSVSSTLIFGDEAARLMGLAEKNSAALNQSNESGFDSCLILPSLSELLHHPHLKYKAWLEIYDWLK